MEIQLPGKSMFYGAGSKTFEAATLLRKNMTLPELMEKYTIWMIQQKMT
jgi:hypothetical protein